NWEFSRFGREFERSNERNGDSPIGPMLSVSEYRGIEVRTNFRDGQLPSEDVSHYRVARPGQLVSNLMWLDHGGLGVSHFPGYVSPAYMAFNISERVDPAFAHHVLRSSVYVDSYKRLGRGVRPNSQMVDSVDLRQLPFPLPPFETQQRIADYLDRETAEIDAAVADLDKYVELLELRARTLIKQQLSGDHPQVKMGLLADAIIGITYSPNDVVEEGGTKVYRSGNVQDSRINRQNMLAVNVEIPPHLRFQEDDILMCSRNGSANLVGKNAIVGPEDLGHTWGAFMTVIRSDLNRYLFWFFRSPQFD